jgi:hypothetical protein
VYDIDGAIDSGHCDARTLVEPLQEHGPSRLRVILGALADANVRLGFPQADVVALPNPRADVQAHVKALASVGRRSADETVQLLWLADVADAWADVRAEPPTTGERLREAALLQLQWIALPLARDRTRLAAPFAELLATGQEVSSRLTTTSSAKTGEELLRLATDEITSAMEQTNTAAFHALSLEARIYLAQFWDERDRVIGPETLIEWGHRMWVDAQTAEPDIEPKMRVSKRACGLHKLYCAVDRVDASLARGLCEAMARRREHVAPNLRCHGCMGSALAALRLDLGDPRGAIEALEQTLSALDDGMKPRRVSLLHTGLRCAVALGDRAMCVSLGERMEAVLGPIERGLTEDDRSPIDRTWVASERLHIRFYLAMVDGELERARQEFVRIEALGESVAAELVDLAVDWGEALDDQERNAEAVRIGRVYGDLAERRGRLGRAQRLYTLAMRCSEDEEERKTSRARARAMDERLDVLRARWEPQLEGVG